MLTLTEETIYQLNQIIGSATELLNAGLADPDGLAPDEDLEDMVSRIAQDLEYLNPEA